MYAIVPSGVLGFYGIIARIANGHEWQEWAFFNVLDRIVAFGFFPIWFLSLLALIARGGTVAPVVPVAKASEESSDVNPHQRSTPLLGEFLALCVLSWGYQMMSNWVITPSISADWWLQLEVVVAVGNFALATIFSWMLLCRGLRRIRDGKRRLINDLPEAKQDSPEVKPTLTEVKPPSPEVP